MTIETMQMADGTEWPLTGAAFFHEFLKRKLNKSELTVSGNIMGDEGRDTFFVFTRSVPPNLTRKIANLFDHGSRGELAVVVYITSAREQINVIPQDIKFSDGIKALAKEYQLNSPETKFEIWDKSLRKMVPLR